MSVRLHVADPTDEVSIRVLMGELMPHADTARRLEWLYRANPDGPAVTVLASDEETGELVGMTSAFPRRMQIGGRIALGALGGDGFVRPQFRRRGVGSLMNVALRAAQAARGIEMMFGTPTPANASALRFAGGRDVAVIRRWVRPLLARRLGVERFVRNLAHPWGGALSRARLQVATLGEAALDVAWADFVRDGRLSTVRDAEFLRWRFQEAPSGVQWLSIVRDGAGRVLGSCVLEVCAARRRVRVIDLVARRTVFARVLHAIVGSIEGADALEIRLDDATARALGLWRYGFVPRESVPLNVVMTSSGGCPTGGWFATWADSDLDTTWRPVALRPGRTGPDQRETPFGLDDRAGARR